MIRHSMLLFILPLFASASSFAQTVWTVPTAPRVGDVLTIYYDPRPTGGIDPATTALWLHWGLFNTGSWATPPQSIWPAGSHIHSDNLAVQSPMTEIGDSVWSVSIDFDTATHAIAFVFTNGQNVWDNNSGQDWHVDFIQAGTVSWWVPEDPEPGDAVTIYYDCVPGTLPNGATSVIMHWGVNEQGHGNWQAAPEEIRPAGTVMDGIAARTPMNSLGGGLFSLTINTIDGINSIHYVTTDGTNWDNNINQNWDIFLEAPPVVQYTHVVFRFDPRGAFSNFSGSITSLNLAGAFNGWSTTANPLTSLDPFGNRWGEVVMPVGRNEYKFVINGNNWQTDPDNPLTAPGGFNNSLAFYELDSLPQVYNVLPGENRTYNHGANVVITAYVRGGDLGPGIMGAPSVFVNGNAHGSNWNSTSGLLTLNALPTMNIAYDTVRIVATDSAGRVGEHYLGYAIKQVAVAAADVTHDQVYSDISNNFDLIRVGMTESASGAALDMSLRYAGADHEETLTLVTISSTTDGFTELPGFGGEVRVPGLASGVAVLFLDPSSPYYNPQIHNRIHPNGDLNVAGPTVSSSYDPGSHQYIVEFATADLEEYLGSYQSFWYFTCLSFKAAGAADGYCYEVGEADGGVAGEEDPDCYDAMFYLTSDIETKLMKNYGLTRRVTMDASGRGIGAILPDSLGPNMRHPGPLCQVLTRGATTTDTTQVVKGRVTTSVQLASVWLKQNDTVIPVTMVADTFVYNAVLVEGENQFTVWAVDVNEDTSNSPAMTFNLVIDHAPNVRISTSVGDASCFMDAAATTDPEGQNVSYIWTADPDNPSPVTINNSNSAQATFVIPSVPGEYYFDLVASDPDNHRTNGRTFFTIGTGGAARGFSNNEAAEWVTNARIYEIFVRSHSPAGNLDGVTADLDRIMNLGVNCIWMMPIFEGPSDHGYEITDYYTVEQDYGTAEDLHELVAAAHARGIRIVLDMVINHTGIGHPFMQDAERYGRYSHYWDWYDRDAQGNPTHYFDWTSLPNINLNNTECAQYWIDMCKYWVSEFDIDGYRCDVAWGPMQRSPQFWVNWRQQLKEIKPECLLLAEAGANDFGIFDNRFDLAFDWNLHHEGTSAFDNMFPSIPGFGGLTSLVTNFNVPWPAYKEPLRFMENHDEVRYISENTAPQTKLVAAFCLTIPGAVMLYAGQEIGMTSQRGQITWGSDPNGMYPVYYRLMNARATIPALKDGEFTPLSNTAWGNVYTFARHGAGMDPVIFAGNFAPNSFVPTITMDLNQLGLHADSTYWISEILGASSFETTGAQLASLVTSLSAYQSRVWVISDTAVYFPADEPPISVPKSIQLGEAFPNPFNPSATLPLSLNGTTHVEIRIYDVLGREVDTLVDEMLGAGEHMLVWNAARMSSGLYFAVMQSGDVREVRKLMLLR